MTDRGCSREGERDIGTDTITGDSSQSLALHPAEHALDCLAFLFATVCDDGRRARGGDRDAVREPASGGQCCAGSDGRMPGCREQQ